MSPLPRFPLAVFLSALHVLAVLSGCDDPPRPAPDAGTLPGEDAGTPWDGGYTVLEEWGDSMEDPGALAPCAFLPEPGSTSPACPEPSQFDLSACDRATLGTVPEDGIYQVRMRYEEGPVTSFSFQFRSDGGPDTGLGTPLTSKQKDGQSLFLAQHTLRADGGSTRVLFAGCEARTPGRFTGCQARCVNGVVRSSATFEAVRMSWREGEAESSGGLQRVSESSVAQGMPVDVYVTKEHAYVVSVSTSARSGKAGGLTVFDVKDRRHPVLKKVISLPEENYWNGVWAKGDALYVASNATGVVVFDITDPANPAFVRTVPAGAAPLDIHTVLVDGDRLYGMAPPPESSTFVFDVSQPLAPVLRQRIQLPLIDSYDGPHDAFAYGGRLYVNHTAAGYHVVDVSNLEDVKLLGTYPYANSYSHHNAVGTFAGRTIAFEGGEGSGASLRVLDVTDPAHIVKIGQYKLRDVTSIHNMLLVGTRLYVAWYHEGVRVLDVSNPTKPREVAHFNTYRETDPERTDSGAEGAIGIRVPGDGYVYVVDTSRGLLIFDEP
ncbi:LVIVD repeat-containing protein [Pyxidicoccus sp. MSG2]|uniref:LVIVD repeat-containing protein n=1 Tax=Pyxidicoccus sp. MSG2 TaxID=2996790 RepID=UPI00226FF2C7|nr:hypothetical protein [Pyxidicoccus sp. MSG2]MCY1023526.1 hypothetical protein [Pyxidicoccus sp. MSG2]